MIGKNWTKSTRSNPSGNCVEVRLGPGWHKSARSQANHCVEARTHGSVVQMRDSKDPHGPVLSFGADQWTSFIDAARQDNI